MLHQIIQEEPTKKINSSKLKNCWPCSKEADGRLKGENESVWKEKDKSGSNDWIRWERTIRKRHFER